MPTQYFAVRVDGQGRTARYRRQTSALYSCAPLVAPRRRDGRKEREYGGVATRSTDLVRPGDGACSLLHRFSLLTSEGRHSTLTKMQQPRAHPQPTMLCGSGQGYGCRVALAEPHLCPARHRMHTGARTSPFRIGHRLVILYFRPGHLGELPRGESVTTSPDCLAVRPPTHIRRRLRRRWSPSLLTPQSI